MSTETCQEPTPLTKEKLEAFEKRMNFKPALGDNIRATKYTYQSFKKLLRIK